MSRVFTCAPGVCVSLSISRAALARARRALTGWQLRPRPISPLLTFIPNGLAFGSCVKARSAAPTTRHHRQAATRPTSVQRIHILWVFECEAVHSRARLARSAFALVVCACVFKCFHQHPPILGNNTHTHTDTQLVSLPAAHRTHIDSSCSVRHN